MAYRRSRAWYTIRSTILSRARIDQLVCWSPTPALAAIRICARLRRASLVLWVMGRSSLVKVPPGIGFVGIKHILARRLLGTIEFGDQLVMGQEIS